ncbi:MAG: GNAT family N-acetyltransferase [Pseudomonadota bacterium]
MSAAETQPIVLKPFLPSSSEGLKKFITQFPRLPYGLEHFTSFVQNLTSGPECVLDLWQGNQRAAVALLLDKSQSNPSNLEIAILGYRWDFSSSLFLDAILPIARDKASRQNMAQLELVSSLGLKVDPGELSRRGFVAGPTTLTFETGHQNPQLLTSISNDWSWQDTTSESVGTCYDLLKVNFPSPDAGGLVPFEKFQKLALYLPIKPRLLFENERAIAFVWVALENQTGQLLFMARHPDYRGKGLGKACLGEATRVLKPFGFKKLQAEVKDTDQAAIKLFEGSGFKTTRKLTRFISKVERGI